MDGEKIVMTVTSVSGNLDLAMMEATINFSTTTRRLNTKTTPKEEGQESGVPDQGEKSKEDVE